MKLIIILSVLYLTKAQSPDDPINLNPSNCGLRPIVKGLNDSRIVGGTQAIPGDWPWQVLIKHNYGFNCGGILINSQWMMSAAHCTYNLLNPAVYQIDLGMHNRMAPNSWSIQNIKISKLVVHPGFTLGKWENDIFLLKFTAPIKYSDYILPVCIPENSDNYAGNDATATGWGNTREGGTLSSYLNQVTMTWLTDARCKQKYPTSNPIVHICAGETGGNKDTCQGDSGGPLVVKEADGKYYAGGITSWGYGCVDGGVYTRVSHYYQWIKDTIKNN